MTVHEGIIHSAKVSDQEIITTLRRAATVDCRLRPSRSATQLYELFRVRCFRMNRYSTLSKAVLFPRECSFHIPSFGNWFMSVES